MAACWMRRSPFGGPSCISRFCPPGPRSRRRLTTKSGRRKGPPLVVTGQRVKSLLEERLPVPVELAMRYRNPSIETAVCKLREQGVEELLLIPQFPHYAMSSYETAVVRVQDVVAAIAPEMSVTVVPPYYDHPDYIRAMAGSAREYLDQGYDHLLFSFHGIPERHLRKAGPTGGHCLIEEECCAASSPAHKTCYRAQCLKTAEAFIAAAGIPRHRYSIAFQSRLGREPWLKPYTDAVLAGLGKAGNKKLLVICPAFVADCLETLEEIGMRGEETFRAAGGKQLTLIPCLNDHPLWIEALERMAVRWLESVGAQLPVSISSVPP